MSQFLLIHGAFHGAWCWHKAIPELEKRGHHAQAIDLPGQGQDQTPLVKVTLDTMVERIVGALAELPGPVVLVGHSLGGMAISAAAEKAPERIKTLVFLAAFLPRDGEALLTIEQRNPKAVVPKSMTIDADHLSGTIMLDRVRDLFYHDCTDADISYASARLRPQALAVLRTPVHLTPERFGRLRLCRMHRRSRSCGRDAARHGSQVPTRRCAQLAFESLAVSIDARQPCG